jgi:methylglutaconyl-CoA hydratase
MGSDRLVLLRHEEGISFVELNRPEKRNALSSALLEQLWQAIDEARRLASQKVLLLSGNGPIFCAGMDLKEAAQPESIEPLGNLIAKVLTMLYTCPLITIAAVNGAAVAGGAGVMSACDFAIATDDAKIGYPEIKHGLVAAQVATLLVRQVGFRKVRELLLLGELIPAQAALEIGLISQLAPSGQLMATALELARRAASQPHSAIAETKRLLAALEPHPFADDLRIAIGIHRKARRSEAAQQGIAAFLAPPHPPH